MQNMQMNHCVHNSELPQFPQPSKPIHAISESIDFPDTFFNSGVFKGCYMEAAREEAIEGENFVVHESLIRILREQWEGQDEKGRKLFNKLICKVAKKFPFDRLVKELLQEFKGRPITISNLFEKLSTKLHDHPNSDSENDFPTTTERGLDYDDGLESVHKLERFKVKTVKPGGVVKDMPTSTQS